YGKLEELEHLPDDCRQIGKFGGFVFLSGIEHQLADDFSAANGLRRIASSSSEGRAPAAISIKATSPWASTPPTRLLKSGAIPPANVPKLSSFWWAKSCS